jgi:hypothetical protein
MKTLKTLIFPKASDRGTLLASADDDATATATRESATKLRKGAGDISLAVASMLDLLEEPLRGEFVKIKGDIDTMLAALPPSDQVPAAMDANGVLDRLFGMFSNAQWLIDNMKSAMESANATGKAKAALSLNAAEVDRLANEKLQGFITAGDYIKKEEVAGQVKAGITAHTDALDALASTMAGRKTALVTASLPCPSDEVLGDENFDARQATAAERIAKLEPHKAKIKDDKVLQLCWCPDSEFETALGLISDMPATTRASAPATGASPFIFAPPAGSADGSGQAANRKELRKSAGCM